MRSMSSREIHFAIRTALGEVSRALASGELDRSGRYYSDLELRRWFDGISRHRNRRRAHDSKAVSGKTKSG